MIKKYLAVLFLGFFVLSAQADYLVLKVVYNSDIDYNNSTRVTIGALKAARPGDEVDILITSNGGRTDAGYDMVDAMHKSKGNVYVIVTTWAASMAANMVCEAPHYRIDKKALLMWHMAFWVDGDGNKIPLDLSKKEDRAIFARANATFRKCGFLTEKEIKRMDNGGEVWLTGAEIHARLKSMGRG